MHNHIPEVKRIRCQRLPLTVPLFVRGLDKNGKSFLEFTSAINISGSGALVVMPRVQPGFWELSLEIPCGPLPAWPSPTHSVRTLEAVLVRVIHLEGFDLWGMRFTHPICSCSGTGSDPSLARTGTSRNDLQAGTRHGQHPTGRSAREPKPPAAGSR
jgi:hypothetical protein